MTKDELIKMITDLKLEYDIEDGLVKLILAAKKVDKELFDAVADVIEIQSELYNKAADVIDSMGDEYDALSAEVGALTAEKKLSDQKVIGEKRDELIKKLEEKYKEIQAKYQNPHEDQKKIEEIQQNLASTPSAH